jgi:hypothetical protein
MFDFAGTGVTSAQDADPLAYEIATGALSLSSLAVEEPAKVLGFVAPFGAAPPDFEARTVIDHRDLPALIGIGWGEAGTTAPFLSSGPAGLVPDLANPSLGARHHLLVGRRSVDLLDLPSAPTIAAAPSGRTMFGLAEAGHIELFADFDEFVAALDMQLGGGTPAVALFAAGAYDEAANTLDANRIVVHLAPAN